MSLPEQFIYRTKSLLGEEWDAFEKALALEAPTAIRVNPVKSGLFSKLKYEKVLWSDFGYYLPKRPNYTFDPLFHAGCYYPQEASSMFVEQAVRQYVMGDGLRVLDLCAAPGGKSTHLLSLIGKNSLLVSNEVIRPRANILAENITKWGFPNTIVTNNDPAEIGKMKGYFDAILVDAPCSGEGMFRKDRDAVDEWSESNVRLCKERQRRIVADVWDALKPDGIMIYSTCTYNAEENEDNVRWISETLGADILPLDISDNWGITSAVKGDIPVYRFFPHRTKGEGFFIAVLRKIANSDSHNKKVKNKKSNSKQPVFPKEYQHYLKDVERFSFFLEKGRWLAVPSVFTEDYIILTDTLKVLSAGVGIGEQKGKDLIPSQSLAMSVDADLSVFPAFGIEWDKAVSFLRKETFMLPQELPRGYILLKHRGVPLGFMKNIGNRANNLYPNEWRVRTRYTPENFMSII